MNRLHLHRCLTSLLRQDGTNGEVVVNHIITGGSADRSGIIQLGDIVVSVDSRDIRGKVCTMQPV